jgi:hypothetical protein
MRKYPTIVLTSEYANVLLQDVDLIKKDGYKIVIVCHILQKLRDLFPLIHTMYFVKIKYYLKFLF